MQNKTSKLVSTGAGAAFVIALGLGALSLTGQADQGPIYRSDTWSADQAAEHISGLRSAAPAEQQVALADSGVDVAEYRGAVNATIECIRSGFEKAAAAAGVPIDFQVTGPELTPDQYLLDYSYSVKVLEEGFVPTKEQEAAIAPIARDCTRTHLRQVESAYQGAWRSDSARLTSAEQSFVLCLQEHGRTIEAGLTPAAVIASILERPEALTTVDRRCFDDYPSLISTPAD